MVIPLSSYYIDGNSLVTKRMDDFYQYSYPLNAALWAEGMLDKRFKAGDQTLWNAFYGDTAAAQARPFFFNRIRRLINMVVGYQRRNRKSIISEAVESGDAELSEQYTKMLLWQTRQSGLHEYVSQAFEGACDVGISLLHTYPDYSIDPVNGNLNLDYVAFNNFLIDPYFRKQDLSDCNGIWRRRWVSKEMAIQLMPQRAKEISKMRPQGVKDGRFPLQAELISYDVSQLYTYDEFHYMASRKAKVVMDLQFGEVYEWDGDDNELEQIVASQPWLMVKEIEKPTVKLCIVINGRPMYEGPNLLGLDWYPFVPVLCYYDPDLRGYSWRCQGIIRNLRDAQYLYNRRRIIELDILESQINSGWIVPSNTVADHRELFKTGQNQIINLQKNRLANELVRIDAPAIPESMMALSQSMADEIMQISGINEELLGSAEDDKAGILAQLRQGAGLTTLQTPFDRLDYSVKLLGRLWMQAIPKMYTYGKVRRVLGEEPNPKFFTADVTKYDVASRMAVLSDNQKQLQLKQLLFFKELGIYVSDKRIIEAAQPENEADLLEDIEQQTQQQQQQMAAQMQAQQQEAQIKAMEGQARAQASQATAKERLASADEKTARIAEIEASAEQKSAEADLTLVKEILTLEEHELGNLQKLMDLAIAIRDQRQQGESRQIVNTPNLGGGNGT